MKANLLNGKEIADQLAQAIASEVTQHLDQHRRAPSLSVILVGSAPASEIYVKKKHSLCQKVGIKSHVYHLSDQIKQEELTRLIESLNRDTATDGILVQLPLPATLPKNLTTLIDPQKDVDGFHPYNIGKLLQREPILRPCTPKGIVKLLQHTKEQLCGKIALVVGASDIVGRPMALELLLLGCTTVIAHRFTQNLADEVKRADILIVAVGKPHFIPGDWIKPGAIVIDVGINRTTTGTLMGDVDFELAQTKASWITPVPGGVGPMTVVSLLENTLIAYKHRMNIVETPNNPGSE